MIANKKIQVVSPLRHCQTQNNDGEGLSLLWPDIGIFAENGFVSIWVVIWHSSDLHVRQTARLSVWYLSSLTMIHLHEIPRCLQSRYQYIIWTSHRSHFNNVMMLRFTHNPQCYACCRYTCHNVCQIHLSKLFYIPWQSSIYIGICEIKKNIQRIFLQPQTPNAVPVIIYNVPWRWDPM